MMVELMTREEMIRRIENGENATELSIEKWERVRSIHPAERISNGLGSGTCALCYVNDSKCNVCKLKEVMGDVCITDRGNPWGDAISDAWEQEDNGGVDRLIEMLIKCREEKIVIELMTGVEMVERLDKGENPVELAIEKWERVEDIYLQRQVYRIDIHETSCALCYINDSKCGECIFTKVHGHRCTIEEYDNAHDDVIEQEDNGGVRRMIEALKKCRDKEEKIETFGEAMDRLLKVHTRMILLAQNCEGTGLWETGKLIREMVGEIELVLREMKDEN